MIVLYCRNDDKIVRLYFETKIVFTMESEQKNLQYLFAKMWMFMLWIIFQMKRRFGIVTIHWQINEQKQSLKKFKRNQKLVNDRKVLFII